MEEGVEEKGMGVKMNYAHVPSPHDETSCYILQACDDKTKI